MKETTLNEYEKAVNKVIDYISLNLFTVPSIRELTEVAGISGFHLHRVFKMIIGENIGEFIVRLRLEDIALRLLMSDDTITDIALTTGYGSKHALSRAFKNHFGISPSTYRLQSKNLHPFFGDEIYENVEMYAEERIIEDKSIVYIRVIDIYGAEESYRNAWYQLRKFAKTYNLLDTHTEFIGLSFDDPSITHPSRCRFYACITTHKQVKPEGAFGIRHIAGGKYMVFTHQGPYYKLKEAYYNIYNRFFLNNNYRLKGSMSFEKYLNSPTQVKEEKLLTEIYIPIYSK